MSVNSLLFPNPRQLHCGQINVSGLASNLAMIPPIVTNSTRFCANVYVQRAMFSDATGNIFSPSLTISNNASPGNVLTGSGANTADWAYPIVRSDPLVISGVSANGQVLTATGVGTAHWTAPGAITGNISCTNIVNSGTLTTDDLIVNGTFTLSGAIAPSSVNSAGTITGTQIISSISTGTAPLSVTSTTLVPNLYVARSALSDVATSANVALALKSATTSVDVSAATAPSANQYLRATSDTTAIWGSLPAVQTTFSDTSFSVYDAVDNTKQVLVNAVGTTGTSTTLTSSQTSSRVLTLPDATDTLVGKATTDAMSNKTLTDASNNVIARSLWNGSGSASVSVYAATAPTTGQALIATSPTTMTWQTLPTAGTGMIKQIVSDFAVTGANSSGTSMPYITTPVITDGTQYCSITITPTSASSLLKIEAQIVYTSGGGSVGRDSAALFKVGTTNALVQNVHRRWNNNEHNCLTLTNYITAGTTSAITFTVRIGNEHGYAMANTSCNIPNNFIMVTELGF